MILLIFFISAPPTRFVFIIACNQCKFLFLFRRVEHIVITFLEMDAEELDEPIIAFMEMDAAVLDEPMMAFLEMNGYAFVDINDWLMVMQEEE